MAGSVAKNLSIPLLVLANLVPLAGIIYFEWNLTAVLMLYWIENLVIGAYAVVKILFAGVLHRQAAALFTSVFFIVHYGLFWSGHGFFLSSLLDLPVQESQTWLPAPFGTGLDVLLSAWSVHGEALAWATFALVVSHGFSLFENFIGNREFESRDAAKMPFDPYKRVFLLHVSLIAGAILIEQLGQKIYLLVLLVGIKVAMDVWLHRREHADSSDAENPPLTGQEQHDVQRNV